MNAPLIYRQSNEEMRKALLWSLLLHIAVVLFFAMQVDWLDDDDIAIPAKVIDAVIVDSSVLEPPKVKPKTPAKKPDVAEQQKQRELEIKRQQQAKQEAIRLEKKKAEAEEAERIRQQKLEQERQRREQERLAEEQRLLEQAQQEEWERLQAEEAAAAEQARSNVLAQQLAVYKRAIKQRVERNWIRPISAEDWFTCEVLVEQIPGGDVVNVEMQSCDGDAVFHRSIINAVNKSSPLPDPPDPALFDRKLKFTFKVPSQ